MLIPSDLAPRVLVDVEAAGVNFIDTYRRSGVYPMEYPHIVRSEGTGRIAEAGEGVESWQVDDSVAGDEAPGSYATQVVVNTDFLLRAPEGVSAEVAAAMPLQGLIVMYPSEEIDQAMLDYFSLVVAVASDDRLHLR